MFEDQPRMTIARPLSQTSLERLIPETLSAGDATGAETLELHLARYRFASRFVAGGRVLDCACGVGYGTALLADAERRPDRVLGVDIDPAAVDHARRTYLAAGIEFRCGDGAALDDPAGFDTIVSLETVEHVAEPAALLGNFARLLRPGGTLVASVPVTPSVDVNPYHLHDFTERSFRALGAALGLTELDALAQRQPFSVWKIASGQEARLEDMRQNLPGYYLNHPGALSRRLWATLTHGFCNKYLTVAWRKPAH
jgi:2-polyprenyl-3-methyl-5-hydroxy-6-metoxy-1,4-benzoquinol methylase